jgi:hypothetical protein
MQSQIVHHQHGGQSFVGREAVSVFQCKVIARALRFYHDTGMKVNRAYTPSNMLATASHLTGQKFKRGEYIKAAEALDALAAQTLATEVEVISD